MRCDFAETFIVLNAGSRKMEALETVTAVNSQNPPFDQIIFALDNYAGSDIFRVAMDRDLEERERASVFAIEISEFVEVMADDASPAAPEG
jgi:hypothetical protein